MEYSGLVALLRILFLFMPATASHVAGATQPDETAGADRGRSRPAAPAPPLGGSPDVETDPASWRLCGRNRRGPHLQHGAKLAYRTAAARLPAISSRHRHRRSADRVSRRSARTDGSRHGSAPAEWHAGRRTGARRWSAGSFSVYGDGAISRTD